MNDFQPPVKRVIDGEIVEPIFIRIAVDTKAYRAALEQAKENLRKMPARRVYPWEHKDNAGAINGECSAVNSHTKQLVDSHREALGGEKVEQLRQSSIVDSIGGAID